MSGEDNSNEYMRGCVAHQHWRSTIFTFIDLTAAMAPYINGNDSVVNDNVDSGPVKAKVGDANVKLGAREPPPVADDFMYDFKYNHALPTSDVLGIEIPADCDAQKEAAGIIASLSEVMGKGDAQGFADMFLDYG